MKLQSPLNLSIHKESRRLIELVSSLSISSRTLKQLEIAGGKASPADLIAYQIGWGRCLIRWYESGIKGEESEMPEKDLPKWDYGAIASHFYRKYSFDQAEKQIEEFEQVVRAVLLIVENEAHTGNLDKLGVWDWCTLKSGKQWPLEKWVRVNTLSPYKRAFSLIAKEFPIRVDRFRGIGRKKMG